MNDWVAAFSAFIVAHRAWAAPAFGLLAFGESLAVVGTVIPATPILFLVGTLLGRGELDMLAVLGWAIPGAIAGYWLSWAAGRRLGTSIYRAGPLARQRRGVARARLFFRRWGGPALVFGRYLLGPFQSTLPLVAGVAAMDARRFHAWNTASGVVWVIVCLLPGYMAGRGAALAGLDDRVTGLLVTGLAVLSVALVVIAFAAAGYRALRRGASADGQVRR